ncbi:hypothetical protein R3P38DRAFT_2559353, partial [Favolaschia claudopus]
QTGLFSLDNAGNNNTTMVELEDLFMEELERLFNDDESVVVFFDAEGNRIRCFAHIISIASQTILKELAENPYYPVIASSTEPQAAPDLLLYAQALESNPINKVREIAARPASEGRMSSKSSGTRVMPSFYGVHPV